MNAWIYVITNPQRPEQVRLSYMEMSPNEWFSQQNQSDENADQLQYAVQSDNPLRVKWQVHQHLHACKCLPDDKYDDWFDCVWQEAMTVVKWASSKRLAELYANDGKIWQNEHQIIQQKQQKKSRLLLGLKCTAAIVCVGVAFWAFRWWWTH